MAESIRAYFEPRFGVDFSHVRVHTDSSAIQKSRELNAEAFTYGRDVYFGNGKYSSSTSSGRRLLAHELAHVVQQGKFNPSVPSIQRQEAIEWRNAVTRAENQIQELIRAAQRDRRSHLQLEIVVDPDFVGMDRSSSTGRVPANSPEPDGFAVYEAAHRALEHLTISAPSSRRVYSVVLERSGAEWQLQSSFLIGETFHPRESEVRPATEAGEHLDRILQQADSAQMAQVRLDIVISPDGVRVASWRGPGTRSATGQQRQRTQAFTTQAVASLTNLIRVVHSEYPLVYTTEFNRNGVWSMRSFAKLAELRPAPVAAREAVEAPHSTVLDEGELVIQEIRETRQLILSTAATLIAEQDPTRLDNLLFSVGPFALAGVLRVGRLGRIGRLIGRPARRIFGEVRFRGMVQNRPLRELTHAEIYDAFRTTQFTPSNHAISRLKDIRTSNLGVETLNDVARHLNNGIIEDAGEGLLSIQHGRFEMIVNPETNILVSFSPL